METKREAPIQFRDAELAPKLDERGSRNEVAKRDLARYYALIEGHAARLPFSNAEWMLLRDALNGSLMGDHPSMLWAAIEDAIRLDGLADKWTVDGGSLVAKLRAMSPTECLATIDAVERWWIAREGA